MAKPRTILVLNEASVSSARGVTFHLNPATKHPENPVLIPGYPHEWDSLQINWPSRVLYDPRDRLFRCWYHGLDVVQYDPDRHPERKGFARWLGRIWRNGYAESTDGVRWTKPPLGQYEHRGRDTNAIRTDYEQSGTGIGWDHYASLHAVWLNPRPKTPDDRFNALFTEVGADAQGNRSLTEFRKVLYISPDGKSWARRCVVYEAGTADGSVAPDLIDISSVVVDPDEADPSRRVKAYGQSDRPTRPGRGNRGVALLTGPDFLSLGAPPRVLLEGDFCSGEEIHWSAVARLDNGQYAMIHDSSHFDYEKGIEPPASDIRLAISPDGVNFRRIHPGTAIVPRGRESEFDANMLVSGSVVEFADQVLIYYHGAPCTYRPWPRTPDGVPYELRAATTCPTFLGLAIVPRDRFACARGPGSITIDAVTLGPDGLWINADDDHLTIRAGDAVGRPGPLRRHTVYRNVIWDVAPPAGPCRLTIELPEEARVYSLQT